VQDLKFLFARYEQESRKIRDQMQISETAGKVDLPLEAF